MRVSPSGTEVTPAGLAAERRQTPQSDPWWQDSVVLAWWDLKLGVGGYHRIGHQPGHPDGPRVELVNNVFSHDKIFKRCQSLPLTESARLENGFGSDGTVSYVFDDHPVWTFASPEVDGVLHLRDHHEAVDIYPKGGHLAERISSGHLEAAGVVTGTLTLDGRTYEIDGLAIRDRGWGVRHWDEILAHRWVAANFGPEASVYAVSVLGADGTLSDFGCVIRGDELMYAKKVDIVTYMERDGLTHRGGHVRLELVDGEVVELRAEVLAKGAVSWMVQTTNVNDTLCKATWAERVGICDFEISNNASAGKGRPVMALNGVIHDGLHEVSAIIEGAQHG